MYWFGRERDGGERGVRVEREAAPPRDIAPADEPPFAPAWLLCRMEDAGVRLEPRRHKDARDVLACTRESVSDPCSLGNVVTPREFAQ